MSAIELTPKRLDVAALEQKVKSMYRDVALDPHGEFHFEMGRALAERLGYAPTDLDAIPAQAIDSFAGGEERGVRTLSGVRWCVDLDPRAVPVLLTDRRSEHHRRGGG